MILRIITLAYLWLKICIIKLFCSKDFYENRMIKTIETSGPLFVKLFQLLVQKSAYHQLFSKTLIQKIQNLQNNCTPVFIDIPYEVVKLLGVGSIAQTYLIKHQNELRVIKIIIPNVREKINNDIKIIRTIIPYIPYINIEYFINNIERQTNFIEEVRNLEKIKANFLKLNKYANFPTIYEYNSNYIIMNYINGKTFDELDENLKKEAKVLTMACLIKMIFKDYIFHSDCHNGNILYTYVNNKLIVNFIDFGMVSQLNSDIINSFLELLRGLTSGNFTLLLNGLKYCVKDFDEIKLKKKESEFYFDFKQWRDKEIMNTKNNNTTDLVSLTIFFLHFVRKNNLFCDGNLFNALLNLIILEQDFGGKILISQQAIIFMTKNIDFINDCGYRANYIKNILKEFFQNLIDFDSG